MKKLLLVLVAVLCIGAVRFSSDKLDYETQGQAHWFVTPSGGGDCYHFWSPCTFREAVAKCTSGIHDIIHLSPGDHDADNLSDASGTTIAVNDVEIRGFGDERNSNTRIINSDAAAEYVLQVTGTGFYIENVIFNNSDQTDTEVVLLRANNSLKGLVKHCKFQQTAGASGSGIVIEGTSSGWQIIDNGITGLETVGLSTGGTAHGIVINKNCFCSNETGIHLTGTSNSQVNIFETIVRYSGTAGVDIDATTTSDILLQKVEFVHNTEDIIDEGDWDTVHLINVTTTHQKTIEYPADAGVQVSTGDGVYTWGDVTTIIPASTITGPFYISAINVQAYNAAQIYKLEVFYGQVTADQTLGIHSFSVDAANPTSKYPVTDLFSTRNIPANSIVGIRLKSSTADVDTAIFTITLSSFSND